MGFFLGLIAIFFFVVLLVLALAAQFLRSLFGFGRKSRKEDTQGGDSQYNTESNSSERQKVFDRSEGEYVEYEEIVDEEKKHKE